MSLKSTFSNSTSKSYALALYELAKENSELSKVEDGIKGLKTLLSESSDFKEMVLNPIVTKEKKNPFKLINKKPIIPSNKEIKENPPSRSAKLRFIIKEKNILNFKTDILDKFNYLIKIENYSEKL